MSARFTLRERFYIWRAIRQNERRYKYIYGKENPLDADAYIYSSEWKNRFDLSWEDAALAKQHEREKERARVLGKVINRPIVGPQTPVSWGTCYSEDHDHEAVYSMGNGVAHRICMGGY